MNWKERYKKANIIHIDLDGTICNEECFTAEECINATLNQAIWRWMWKIHNDPVDRKFIIINTARRTKFARETIEWLDKNSVPFDGVSFRKSPSDLYIDDKCVNINDFLKFIGGKYEKMDKSKN